MIPSFVAIVETGVANTAAVVAAFTRLGVEARLTNDPSVVADALAVVLPGVGAFGAGMNRLAAMNMIPAIRDRATTGAPFLGICLGMQLLAEASDESPGVAGLGVLPTTVRRFPAAIRCPQIGWNTVTPDETNGLLTPGYASFANTYRITDPPAGWRTAWTDYGGPFVAALERDATLLCQFHPELSGRWGASLLKRWLVRAGEERVSC